MPQLVRIGGIIGPRRGPSGGGGYTPEATALFAAMASGGNPLSDAYKAIDNTLILGIQATNLWTISDLFYFAPPTAVEDQSLYNWMAPASNKLVPTASPTYIAGQGWKSDGVGAYYSTGLAANLATFYKQDDASMSWAAWDNVTRSIDCGADTSAIANGCGRTAGNNMSGRLNSSASVRTTPNSNGQGVFCISKTSATTFVFYINGVGTPIVASGTTALTGAIFTILRVSGGFAPNTLRLGYYRIGKSVTDQQALDEYNAVRTAARAVDPSLLP